MIDKSLIYAVIGATNNAEKYGYKVFKDLKEAGYNVVAINPNEKNEILGSNPYHTLSDYNNKIDVVIFVVPPQVTEKVLEEVKSLGIRKVWMQPGAESPNAIKFCTDNSIDYTANSCIMIQRKQ